MTSRRDRDDRGDRRGAAPPSSNRMNEYFLPREGIDREVITADICRYLGNDALVRPGTQTNPQTRAPQPGYFITAYRNLTTAMVEDLKADSARWEQEQRQASAGRGQLSNGISPRGSEGSGWKSNAPVVGYTNSQVHQSRQYYGPTEPVPGATPAYAASTATMDSQSTYSNNSGYQQPSYGGQQQPSYGQQPQAGYAIPENQYYIAGSDMGVETPRRVPVQQSGMTVPRGQVAYAGNPTVYQQQPPQDGRGYSSAGPQYPASSASQQYSTHPTQQPTDPYYGRAAPVSAPQDQDAYFDSSRPQYIQDQQPSAYSSAAPLSSNQPATSNSSSRRERSEPERERERHGRHGGSSRR